MPTFNASRATEIDQSTIEVPEIQFPLVQWCYGDAKLAKTSKSIEATGGFFLSEANIPLAIKDEFVAELQTRGWQADSLTLRDGNDLAGYSARELTMSVINMRRRWKAGSDGSTVYYPWGWDHYQKAVAAHKRAVSQLHAYTVLSDLEVYGAVILTLSGSAAMAFEGSRSVAGVLQQFTRTVIAAANSASVGARWPIRQFWLSVGADRDGKGRPKFTEMGSADKTAMLVLPVALGLPDDPKKVDLDDYYVGDSNFDIVNTMYELSIEWKSQWDNFGAKPVADRTETAAADSAEDEDFYTNAGM